MALHELRWRQGRRRYADGDIERPPDRRLVFRYKNSNDEATREAQRFLNYYSGVDNGTLVHEGVPSPSRATLLLMMTTKFKVGCATTPWQTSHAEPLPALRVADARIPGADGRQAGHGPGQHWRVDTTTHRSSGAARLQGAARRGEGWRCWRRSARGRRARGGSGACRAHPPRGQPQARGGRRRGPCSSRTAERGGGWRGAAARSGGGGRRGWQRRVWWSPTEAEGEEGRREVGWRRQSGRR